MALLATEEYSGGIVRDQDGRTSVAISAGQIGGTGLATELTLARRFGAGKTTAAVSVSTAGDNTIHAPASGKTLTVFWVGFSSSQNNTAEVLVTLKLGARTVYLWNMGNPGAFMHWEPETADNPNDALIVNLSTAQAVLINYTYTEA